MRKTMLFSLLMLVGLVLSACGGQAGAVQSTITPMPALKSSGMIIAEGKVIPARFAELSFKVSGVLDEVLFEEGQSVQAGQVIARLAGSERIQFEIKAAEMDVLLAEQDMKELQDGSVLARAEAQKRLAEAEKELDKVRKDRNSKDYKYGDREQVDIAYADVIVARDTVDDAEEAYNQVSDRADDDPIRAGALSALAAARQRLDRAEANYNYLLRKPDPLEVNLAQATLELAEQKVVEAKLELEKLANGTDPDQAARIQIRLDSAKARLEVSKANLGDLELIAPFSGTLVTQPLKVGQLVSPGNPLVVIADLTIFHVETVDLTELDVLNVQLGEKVMVRLDAIPNLELEGKILRIHSVGTNYQGDVVYAVLVELVQTDPRLLWNMTAAVEF